MSGSMVEPLLTALRTEAKLGSRRWRGVGLFEAVFMAFMYTPLLPRTQVSGLAPP
jgi:hypothetical protein